MGASRTLRAATFHSIKIRAGFVVLRNPENSAVLVRGVSF